MAESIFAIVGLLYFVVATKVDEWETISRLGFLICTPAHYLRKPQHYHYTSWALFWSAAISCFWFSIVPLAWGVLALLLLFFLSGIIGHRKGFKTYRRELAGLLEVTKLDGDEEMRANILRDLHKSDSELLKGKRIAGV
jgi:hypothetical protein